MRHVVSWHFERRRQGFDTAPESIGRRALKVESAEKPYILRVASRELVRDLWRMQERLKTKS